MNVQGFKWCWLPTRLAVYARDGWCCLACGRPVRWRKGRGKWTDKRATAASLDHVTPTSHGGSNAATNLVTLCVGCNSSRADRPVEEWRPELVDVFAIAASTPIDRELGRALCLELAPRVLELRRARDRRRSAQPGVPL